MWLGQHDEGCVNTDI